MKIKYKINKNNYHFEEVEKLNLYCPNCGEQEVYSETSEGDYYEGETHYCKNCTYSFTMPTKELNDEIIWLNNDT
jgi:transcription elongation factor Elf1